MSYIRNLCFPDFEIHVMHNSRNLEIPYCSVMENLIENVHLTSHWISEMLHILRVLFSTSQYSD